MKEYQLQCLCFSADDAASQIFLLPCSGPAFVQKPLLSLFTLGMQGTTSLVDGGTPPGLDFGRYARECWLSALGVLHSWRPL